MIEASGHEASLPQTIGPYRIEGLLGRGGMGVVYQAGHVETHAKVALKTVSSMKEGHIASLRREIRALEGLRHPGVVRTVDQGVDAGVPWYAMQLLVGRTLRDELEAPQLFAMRSTRSDVGTGAPALGLMATVTATAGVDESHSSSATVRRGTRSKDSRSGLLLLLAEVCDALHYLHSAGVVHRDLKPENIFVRSGGTPVLVDLGLATSFGGRTGRERLDFADKGVGTAAYMAPEQILGELVDARADLYALGCILYECLTGEPPFRSAYDHLHKRCLPPSELADDVSPELDRLVLSLLEKAPHDRIGYATDAADVLDPERRGRNREEDGERRPYLYRPPFVGREAVGEELREAVGQVKSHGGRIYVAGESGVGKTRLLMEMVASATSAGPSVIVAQCGTQGGPSHDRPLSAFAATLIAIADHCRREGPVETRRVFGRGGRVLASYEPALAEVPGFASLPAFPPCDPREARARLLRALGEVLAAYTEKRPLVLVIDDLQWADDLTLAFLTRPVERDMRLLLVAAYRSDEAGDDVLAAVAADGARRITLDRFDRRAVGKLIVGMLALDSPADELESVLHERCNGNPFFVVAYLQAAVAGGILTRREGRWSLGDGGLSAYAPEMPTELADLIDLRLLSLGQEALSIVDVAAVLGREFGTDLLFGCAESDAERAADTLETLRARSVVEEAGNGNLRFSHDRIRERAYDRMHASRRRVLHQRAANLIEARAGGSPDAASLLGLHFSRAGDHGPAARYFEQSADFATAAFASGAAIERFRSAIAELDHVSGAPGLGRLTEKLGDLLVASGRPSEARDAFDAALSTVEGKGLASGRLRRKVGKTWEIQHRHDEALTAYAASARALEDPDASEDDCWGERVQVRLDRLWVYYWLGDVERMNALLAESADVVAAHGAPFQQARLLQLMSMRNVRSERYLASDETVDLARRAVALAGTMAEPERVALQFVLFFTLVLRGALDEAERVGTAVASWAERAEALGLRVRTITYLTVVARRQSRLDEVRRLNDLCGALCGAPGQPTLGGIAGYFPGAWLANRCWLAWRQGDTGLAKQLGEEALVAWGREREPYPLQWLARFPLLALAIGNHEAPRAELVAGLLDLRQQRLEPALVTALRGDLRDREGGEAVIRVARALAYL